MRWLISLLVLISLAACTAPAPIRTHGSVDKLTVVDSKLGTGDEAVAGMKVTVHYTGWLYDETAADKHGSQFDSSRDHGEPFSFVLGAGHVIAGWDQGVAGMRVGGRRRLTIPARLGYGDRGAGNVIKPGETLIFVVDLLGVR